VGPDAGEHAPVQVPAERDLLAGDLRVHVDQHGVRLAAELRQQGVGLGERRPHRLEEDLAGQVDHSQPQPVRLDHGVAAPRAALGEVGRPHDAGLLVEVAVHLAVAVGVVAERDCVDAEREQLLRGLARDADSARGVLAVDDHEVGLVLLHQLREHGGERPAADPGDDVAYEQELHCERFCQPAARGDLGHHARGQ